jgi:hypothetical protein
MTCALFVITDFLFNWPMTITVTALTALLFGFFWYALPLKRRTEVD